MPCIFEYQALYWNQGRLSQIKVTKLIRLCQRYHKFYLVWCGSSHWMKICDFTSISSHISAYLHTFTLCKHYRLVPIDLSVLLDSTDTNLVIIWSIGLPLAFWSSTTVKIVGAVLGMGWSLPTIKKKIVIVWGQKGCLSIHQCPKS